MKRIRFFVLEMDEEKECRFVCCKGNLKDRPKFCPMVEVLTYVPVERKKLKVENETRESV